MGQAKNHGKNSTGLYPSFLLISKFRNDRDQRDFISSGAAAGIGYQKTCRHMLTLDIQVYQPLSVLLWVVCCSRLRKPPPSGVIA